MQKVLIFLLCSVLICNAEVENEEIAYAPRNGGGVQDDCTDALISLLPYIEVINTNIQERDYGKLIGDMNSIYPEVENAATQCGVSGLQAPSAQCLSGLRAALPYLKMLADDASRGKYVQIVQDSQKASPYVQAAVNSCFSSETAKPVRNLGLSATCLNDLEALLPDLEKLVEDAERGDYWALAQEVLQTVTPLTKAYKDCVGQFVEIVNLETDCTDLFDHMVPYIYAINIDIERSYWHKLVGDLNGIWSLVDEAKHAGCETSETYGETTQCYDLIYSLEPNLYNLAYAGTRGDYSQVQELAREYASQIQETADACGGSVEENTQHRNLGLSATCLNDLEALLPDLEKLVEDAEKGDYWALAQEVLQAVTPLTKAYKNCVGQFSVLEGEACDDDVDALRPFVLGISESIKYEKYSKLIGELNGAYFFVERATLNCNSTNSTMEVSQECHDQIVSILPELKELGDLAREGKFLEIKNKSQEYQSVIEVAEQACKSEELTGPVKISSQCVDDVVALLPAGLKVFKDIEAGESISQIYSEVLSLVPQAEAAFKDCLDFEFDFEEALGLTKEVSSRATVDEIVGYSPGCITDMLALLPYFTAQIRAIDNYEDDLIIGNTHKFYTQIRDTNTKCGSTEDNKQRMLAISSSCETAMKVILPIILEWLNAVEYNLKQVLQDEVIYSLGKLKETAEICSTSILDNSFKVTPSQCVSDVSSVVQQVEELVQQAKEGDISANDFISVGLLVYQVYGECRTVDPTQLLIYLFDLLNTQEQECLEKAYSVGEEVSKLLTEFQDGLNILEAIQDVIIIIPDVKETVKLCRQAF